MPRRKIAKPKLPKPLSQPIEVIAVLLPTIIGEGSIEAAEARLHEVLQEQRDYVALKRAKKLEALLRYYDIDINDKHGWKNLAIALACDFIDGFKTVEKYTKQKKWNEAVLYKLWFEVEEKAKRTSASNACNHLAKKEPWRSLLGRKVEPPENAQKRAKSLYEWYLKAQKSPLVRFAQNAKKATTKMDVYQQLYDMLVEATPM
jgi:hypothetical protein